MERRDFLRNALAGLLASGLPVAVIPARGQDGARFDFESLVARARTAAETGFVRPKMTLTGPFADLRYDSFRGIRFRDEARLFTGGQGFQMDLMPPGFYYEDRVAVNVVRDGAAAPIPFSTDFFDFQERYFGFPEGRAPSGQEGDMGFSGIRFRHPINRPGVWDEVLVFQGASYFRAVARDTLYGLSARGLAIGTGSPDPEEFPLFTEFWVEEPEPGARTLRIHALLDGPSVAGAYRFIVTPGAETVMEVEARLFPRTDIAAAGIAPLTSMYFFGPEKRAGVDDFRDAVHDSDALRIVNGAGERLWRPLRNPAAVETSSFLDRDPQSFGLIQRSRAFTDYQDAEARYEQRPSAWVEPGEPWGPGAVQLVELPTADEFADNIVAFWRPAEPLAAGREHRFTYRLVWAQAPVETLPLARVLATRGGASILDATERVFVIDFDLGMINFVTVEPRVSASTGEVKGLSIAPLPGGNIARVGFHLIPGEASESELRLTLLSEGTVASEVWLYRWTA